MTWLDAFDLSMVESRARPFLGWAFNQVLPDVEWGNTPDGRMVHQRQHVAIRFRQGGGLWDGRMVNVDAAAVEWWRAAGNPARDDELARYGTMLLHECFHAWDSTHLTDRQRADLLALMGGDTWDSPDTAYHRQGVERFAYIALAAFTRPGTPIRDRNVPHLHNYGVGPADLPEFRRLAGVDVPPPPPQPRPKLTPTEVIFRSYTDAGRDPWSLGEARGVGYWVREAAENRKGPRAVVDYLRHVLGLSPWAW